MQNSLKNKKKITSSVVALILLEIFCFVSFFYSIYLKDPQFAVLSLVAMALISITWIVEKCFHVRFTTKMEIFVMVLIVCCTVVGHIWQMYYIIPLWDKIVHTVFGFVFASFGYVLPMMADRKKGKDTSKALCILCAIMAVVTASAIWEYSEFICDYVFHMDLQHDTVVHRITSYKLGSALGEQGIVENIKSVVINGQEIGLNGYLDIGLYDTMLDMITATIGGVIFCILLAVEKGKFVQFMIPKIYPWKKEDYLKVLEEEKQLSEQTQTE